MLVGNFISALFEYYDVKSLWDAFKHKFFPEQPKLHQYELS